MRVKMLVAVLAAALVAVVATSAAVAGPTQTLQMTPGAIDFGYVAIDSSVTVPLTIMNKTGGTLYYVSAHWPNFDNPIVNDGHGAPYGFWTEDPFPCWTIDSKGSCTIDASFKPFEAGNFSSHFTIVYSDQYPTDYGVCNPGAACYSVTTKMIGTGIPAEALSSELQIAPAALNFGKVALDDSVTRSVTIFNYTGETLYYQGAHWPNFDNPIVGEGYPHGFWNVDDSFDDCLEIAPYGSCTTEFFFKPFEAGNFSTHFTVFYNTDYSGYGTPYSYTVPMWGTGY